MKYVVDAAAREAYITWIATKKSHPNIDILTYEYYVDYLEKILDPNSSVIPRSWVTGILNSYTSCLFKYVSEQARTEQSNQKPKVYKGPTLMRRLLNILLKALVILVVLLIIYHYGTPILFR